MTNDATILIFLVLTVQRYKKASETDVSQWENKVPFREKVLFRQSQKVKKARMMIKKLPRSICCVPTIIPLLRRVCGGALS
jgi:hypothetical protein